MKLIVGLGNPGRQYVETRHNVGFEVLELLGRRCGRGSARSQFAGETLEAEVAGERVLLLKPLTYMNRSGESVVQVRDFYKLSNSDLLVVCDDFSLPLGRLRIRSKGSSGGQKGLQDIIRRLGSEEFARLRIGIGTPPPQWDPADYVLSRFTKEDQPVILEAIGKAGEAVEGWVREGTAACMNRYNAAPGAPERPAARDDGPS